MADMMRRWRSTAAVAISIAVLLSAGGGGRTALQAHSESAFDFALIGDLGYTSAEDPLLLNVFAELNEATLAFVVHDGDLWGAVPCTDERYDARLALFQSSVHPLRDYLK